MKAPSVVITFCFVKIVFFGGDRIGDDNHIALGLTSRIISENTGQERLRASIGQMYYLSDREVGLTANSEPETETKSDIFAELNAVLTNQIDFRSFCAGTRMPASCQIRQWALITQQVIDAM